MTTSTVPTTTDVTPAAVDGAADVALAPARTPRSDAQITRRLVGVSRWPLVLLTAAYAINVSDQFLLPSVFPLLKAEFGLSDTQLGLLSGSYLIAVMLLTVPFGSIADRFSRTKIIGWGTAIWGTTMLWTGLSRSYPSLLGSRMVLGAVDPCDNPTSQSLLADYYPVSQRTKVMGVYQIGQLFGIFLLPIAGAMAMEWGWRSAFFFFSLPAFVIAILARRLPEPVRGAMDRRHARVAVTTAIESPYDSMTLRQAYREILRVRTFTAAMASSAIASLFFGAIGVWSATYMVRYLDFNLSQAATATALLAIGGIVGALTAGYIADALAHSGHPASRLLVSATARIATAPLLFIAFSMSNPVLMLVFFFLGALTLTAAQPPLNAARADVLHPSLRGRGTSLDAVAQALGAAAAPILMGVLADATSLRTAFQIMIPAVLVGGLVLLVFGLPSYRADEQAMRESLLREALEASSSDGGDATARAALVMHDPAEERAMLRREDVLVEVEELCFSYGSVQVLFDTSLEIPRGGCHALIGRNGVGKTTLLNNLAGLVDAQDGRILYDGLDLTGVPSEQRVRLGISLMAGGRATFPTLTVRDNLWLGAFPYCDEHELVEQRLGEVLDVFPQLADRLSQAGGTLSGGEQQMLALGRSLMAGPELLLVDELSLGLAPKVTRELLGVLSKVRDLGTTVVIVEQSVGVALEIADTVMFMEKGNVVDLGPASELHDEQLVAMMLGRSDATGRSG